MTTKKEERKGLQLVITDLKNPKETQRIRVSNWPKQLYFYTDFESRQLGKVFHPEVIQETIGRALPSEQTNLEETLLAIIGMSGIIGEFGGFDCLNLQRSVVPCINFYLEKLRKPMRTIVEEARLRRCEQEGYLRKIIIQGNEIYFPTRKGTKTMCNALIEEAMGMLAIHTGVNIGTGHRDFSEYGD